ncbi:MAG TPA: glycosyltransferase [Terriglobales bacterium]|nr:glycosyltransferase [Terriglobales bacterium]
MGPATSIVIPTKNAGEGFRDVLEAIGRQKVPPAEVLVVDSGSSDNTPELARQYGARTISICPSAFNHGETRNLGLRETSSDFCVLLVQDAVPCHRDWLKNLVAPFADERVVGVSAKQEPRADADPFGRLEVEWGNRLMGEAVLVSEVRKWNDFLALNLDERVKLAWFNNVCSAVRRSFWEKHPFRSVPFAEDLDWSVRALAAGRRIAYNPTARVIHSHSRSAVYNLNRQYVGHRIVPKLVQCPFAEARVYTDEEFLRQIGHLCGEVEFMLRAELPGFPRRGLLRNTALAAQEMWQSLLAAMGLRPPRLDVRQTALGQHFYGLLDEIQRAEPACDSALRVHILVQALARSVGVFTASYYNWCEAHGAVSPQMRLLDQALSEGV